jgi:uncharacterized membrane protein YcaP (DUF421 family)
MSVDDLLGKLREHGVDDVRHVRAAQLESDGEMSVIRRSQRKRDSAQSGSSQRAAAR